MGSTTDQRTPLELREHLAALLEAIRCGHDDAHLRARFDDAALAALIAPAAEAVERLVAADTGAALAAARRLVALSDTLDMPALAARARLALAAAQSYGNAFDDAQRTLDAAAIGAQSARDDVLVARVASARIHALARLGRFDEAAAAGHVAAAALRSAGQTVLAARTEANLGVVERMRRRPEQAIERFQAALADWPDEPVSRSQLRSNLAEAFMDMNRFVEADACFREALESLERTEATQAAAIVEGNLADLRSRQGRLDDALRHFERARRRHVEAGAPGDAARLRAEQAEVFAQTGLFVEAIGEYRDAIGQLDATGLVVEAVRARLGLARALLVAGQVDEAGITLGELPHGDAAPALRGRIALVRAEHASRRGDPTAEAGFADAISLLHDRPAEQAAARRSRVAALLDAGRIDDANAEIDHAREVAAAWLLRPLEAELDVLRADWLRVKGRNDEALDALRTAAARFESLRASFQSHRLRTAFSARHGIAEERLALMLVRRGDDAGVREALELGERLHGRALLDLVSGAVDLGAVAAAQGDDPSAASLLREAEALRHQLSAMYAQLERAPSAQLADEWRREVLALEQRAHVVESRLGATGRLGGLLAQPLTSDAIVTTMGRTALLRYLVAEGRLVAIALRNGDIHAAELGDIDAIAELVERWRFCLQRCLVPAAARAGRREALEADLERAAARLFDAVVAPIWPALAGAEAIQIVPAGPLHAVAFHALPCDGRPLIERCVTATMPSVSLLAAIRAAPTSTTAGRLVVGVADDRAPGILDEAREIAAMRAAGSMTVGTVGTVGTAGTAGTVLLAQEDATIARVREASRGAGTIHLACHGRFIAEHPMRSGLRLADGWLTAADLYTWRLAQATVILSACDTGRVALDRGDDTAGLLRGFFGAGAGAVVLSGWPAPDLAALELMRELHRRLDDGAARRRSDARVAEPARALHAAMLALRSQGRPVVEWATFSLVGDAGGGQ